MPTGRLMRKKANVSPLANTAATQHPRQFLRADISSVGGRNVLEEQRMKASAMSTLSEQPPAPRERSDHIEMREIDRTIALARARRAEFLANMVSAGLRRLHRLAIRSRRRFRLGAKHIRNSLSHV